MTEPWLTLLPLIVASAVLPLQIAVTTMLLSAPAGRLGAFAWVAGMTLVRLAQGLVFGLVLGTAVAEVGGPDRPGPIESTLLLVVALAFYVTAARKILKVPDDDAPPPRWMSMVATLRPTRAFLMGVLVVGISPKLWALTLAAIGAIAEAGLDQPAAIATYVVFAIAAVGVHLAILAATVVAPAWAERALGQVTATLERYDRAIMAGLGIVFGTWFLAKALAGLGWL